MLHEYPTVNLFVMREFDMILQNLYKSTPNWSRIEMYIAISMISAYHIFALYSKIPRS